ncbi:MAG: hypothetical protein OCD01_09250 [Fibrobacterales bacterium]
MHYLLLILVLILSACSMESEVESNSISGVVIIGDRIGAKQSISDNEASIYNVSLLVANEPSKAVMTTETDRFGRFVFEDVPNGNYIVLSIDEWRYGGVQTNISLSGGKEEIANIDMTPFQKVPNQYEFTGDEWFFYDKQVTTLGEAEVLYYLADVDNVYTKTTQEVSVSYVIEVDETSRTYESQSLTVYLAEVGNSGFLSVEDNIDISESSFIEEDLIESSEEMFTSSIEMFESSEEWLLSEELPDEILEELYGPAEVIQEVPEFGVGVWIAMGDNMVEEPGEYTHSILSVYESAGSIKVEFMVKENDIDVSMHMYTYNLKRESDFLDFTTEMNEELTCTIYYQSYSQTRIAVECNDFQFEDLEFHYFFEPKVCDNPCYDGVCDYTVGECAPCIGDCVTQCLDDAQCTYSYNNTTCNTGREICATSCESGCYGDKSCNEENGFCEFPNQYDVTSILKTDFSL